MRALLVMQLTCLYLLAGTAAAQQPAGNTAKRPLMRPDESAYQRFLEHQWDRIYEAERIINGPPGARSLAQMRSQAHAVIRKTTGVLDAVHNTLTQTPAPDLFAAYRKNSIGFVHTLRSLIAGFESPSNAMNTVLHEAFLKSRGDRYAFRSIAGGRATKTIRQWLPLGRKQTRAIAFFRQRMTADAAAVKAALAARIEPGDTTAPETAAIAVRTMTVSPCFLPVLVTISGNGAAVSVNKSLETPLGPVPIKAR